MNRSKSLFILIYTKLTYGIIFFGKSIICANKKNKNIFIILNDQKTRQVKKKSIIIKLP